jgi:hypothetical protein
MSPPPSGSKNSKASVISLKIELFVTTAMRISDPKSKWFVSSDIDRDIRYYMSK